MVIVVAGYIPMKAFNHLHMVWASSVKDILRTMSYINISDALLCAKCLLWLCVDVLMYWRVGVFAIPSAYFFLNTVLAR